MRQIILEMLADLALQLDSDAALELKKRRRLRFLFWLVLLAQLFFIFLLAGITVLLFIVGWDMKEWSLPLIGLICLACLYLQVSRTVGVFRKRNRRSEVD